MKVRFFNVQECDYPIPEVLFVQFNMHYFARVCESSELILFYGFYSYQSSHKFSLVLINTNDFFFFWQQQILSPHYSSPLPDC